MQPSTTVRFLGYTGLIPFVIPALLEIDDVAVNIEATHYWVKSRGIMNTNSRTRTTAPGDVFMDRHKTRAEFLN